MVDSQSEYHNIIGPSFDSPHAKARLAISDELFTRLQGPASTEADWITFEELAPYFFTRLRVVEAVVVPPQQQLLARQVIAELVRDGTIEQQLVPDCLNLVGLTGDATVLVPELPVQEMLFAANAS